MKHQNCFSSENFTLIELLVVIAIIAILAGMLLPVLNSVRAKVRCMSCLNTVRQYHLVVQTYTEDYNGWIPGVYTLGGNFVQGKVNMANITFSKDLQKLYPKSLPVQKQNSTFWKCPDVDSAIWSLVYGDGYMTTYGPNYETGSSATPHQGRSIKLQRPSKTAGSGETKISLQGVRNYPSNAMNWNDDGTIGSTAFRHSGPSINVVFWDGHGENRKALDVPFKFLHSDLTDQKAYRTYFWNIYEFTTSNYLGM